MVVSPAALGPENDCAGEGQQQFKTTYPSCRQSGRSTSTNPNSLTVTKIWSWGFTPRLTGRLAVRCNITFECDSVIRELL
jgi:hypothetical protein